MTPKDKWRATLWSVLQLERFDKLVASFEAASPEDQLRTGAVAAEMAASGGPMSPVNAAYLNYTIDMVAALRTTKEGEG